MSLPLSGLRAWIVQRITAVYVGAFLVYIALQLSLAPPASFEQWRAWVVAPAVSIAVGLFFVALLMHAWVGVRDVVLDYVHPPGVRLAVLTVVGVTLVAEGLWALKILFGAVP